jgi:hypothetical protein
MYVTAYFPNPVVLSVPEESTYLSSLGGSLDRCLQPFRRHVDVTLLRRSACAGVKMGPSFAGAAQEHCDPLVTDHCGWPAMSSGSFCSEGSRPRVYIPPKLTRIYAIGFRNCICDFPLHCHPIQFREAHEF